MHATGPTKRGFLRRATAPAARWEKRHPCRREDKSPLRWGYVCAPPASALCHAGSVEDQLEQWRSLPRRLYLDTGTLQTLFDYGDRIFENEPFVATTRDRGVPNLAEEVRPYV